MQQLPHHWSAGAVLLSSCLLSVACSGHVDRSEEDTVSYCIYGGATEPSRVQLNASEKRSVAALYDPELDGLCSAVVVADGIALTAKHCLSPGRRSFGDVELLFGTSAYSAALVRHPTSCAFHSNADAALLTFDAAVENVDLQATPMALYAGVIDESLVGLEVEIAGFGRTEQSSGNLQFARQTIVAVDPATITVDNAADSGACFGDSGGPMLIGTQAGPAVLGILGWGPDHCHGGDHYVRADLLRELSGGGCAP